MCRVCALVVAYLEGNKSSNSPNFQRVPISNSPNFQTVPIFRQSQFSTCSNFRIYVFFSDTAETWSPSTRTPTYSTCGRSSQYWSPVSSSWSHLISSHPGSPRIISSGATSSCTSSSSTSSTPWWCPSTWRGQFPGSFPKRMWALAAFTRGSPKIWNPGVQYQSRAEEGAISLVEKEQILQRGPPEPSLNRSKNGKLTKPRKSCQSSQIKHSGFNLLEKPTDSFQQENRSSGPANRTLAIGCFCTPGTM